MDSYHALQPDGLGGVIIVWRDYRNAVPGGTRSDIYAQRVLADGSIAPGWPVDGAVVARTPNDQELPVVLADGQGGAFVTWEEGFAVDPNIYLQRLTPEGGVMPGWPEDGVPVCLLPGFQGFPQLAPDGSGGLYVGWGDLRDGLVASSVQRVDPAGQVAPGWPPNGQQIAPTFYLSGLIPDGAGGAFLAGRTLGPIVDDDYFLQRFIGSGEIAAGWPADGATVCVAPDERAGLGMVPDGSGGVLLVWWDWRHMDAEIYALRMRSDGTRDPRWPANGLQLTDNTLEDDTADLAADGQGGAYLCWVHSLSAPSLVVQHVTGAGTIQQGWPPGGLVIPTEVSSTRPRIVADGQGGAIVAWEDYSERIRALRLAADGPVSVQVSLVRAEAEPGLVRLAWRAANAEYVAATVERRTATEDWQVLAEVRQDGTGHLEYEDRSISPGVRYAYRLAYLDADALFHTTEIWVNVPALIFSLRGLTPNPSLGDAVVSFSLASGEPATIELFDLTGRLVVTREVGSFGPGSHRVKLESARHLPPGVYCVRLVQGLNRASARAVIMR